MIAKLVFLLFVIATVVHAWQTAITKQKNVIGCNIVTPALSQGEAITVKILTDTSATPDGTHKFAITSTCNTLPLDFSTSISASHEFTLTATAAVPVSSACAFTVTALNPTAAPIKFSASTPSEASPAESSTVTVGYADFPSGFAVAAYTNTLLNAGVSFPVFSNSMTFTLDLATYYTGVTVSPTLRIDTATNCVDNDSVALATVTIDDTAKTITFATLPAAFTQYSSTATSTPADPTRMLTCKFPLAMFPGDKTKTITTTYSADGTSTPYPITHSITLVEVAVPSLQVSFTDMLQGELTVGFLLRPFSKGEILSFTTPQSVALLNAAPTSCPVKDTTTATSANIIFSINTDGATNQSTLTFTFDDPVLEGYLECVIPIKALALTADPSTVQYLSVSLNGGAAITNAFIFPPIVPKYYLAAAINPAGDTTAPNAAVNYDFDVTLVPVVSNSPAFVITSTLTNAHITGNCAASASGIPVIPVSHTYDVAKRALEVTLPSFAASADTLTLTISCPATTSQRLGTGGTVSSSLYTSDGTNRVFQALADVDAKPITYPAGQTSSLASLSITSLRRAHFTAAEIASIKDIIFKHTAVPVAKLFVSEHRFTATYSSQSATTHTVALTIAANDVSSTVLPKFTEQKDVIAEDITAQYIIFSAVTVDARLVVTTCIPADGAIGPCGGGCALCVDGTLCLSNDDCISGNCVVAADTNSYCVGNSAAAIAASLSVMLMVLMALLAM